MSGRFEGYRQASFRGVPFEIPDRTQTGGRRIDVGEVPFGDKWVTRDMGRSARRFTLSGFVFGLTWREDATRLEEALDASGPGLLVHPTRGEINVYVERWSTDEREQDGLDYVAIRMDCVLAGDAQFPAAATDHASTITAAAVAVEQPAVQAFASTWTNPDDAAMPEIVEEEAELDLAAIAKSLNDAARQPQIALNAALAPVHAQLRNVQRVMGAVGAILSLPQTLAGNLYGLLGGLTLGWASLLGLTDMRFPAWRLSGNRSRLIAGQLGRTVETNRGALGRLIATRAAVSLSQQALTMPWAARQEVLDNRDLLTVILAELESGARTGRRRDEALALERLRLATWDGMDAVAAELPRLRAVEASSIGSARALVWRQTGSLAAAPDLVTRNRISNPALVPAGTPLWLKEAGNG